MKADLKVTSEFKDNEEIPSRFTAIGQNISPPLSLANLNPDAETLSIVVADIDAPVELATHWLIWNIPAPIKEIQENISKDLKKVPELNGAYQGKNDFGDVGYTGPGLPSSTFEGDHTYHFVVYVLDKALELEPGATKKELLEAMEDHLIQKGVLRGTYKR